MKRQRLLLLVLALAGCGYDQHDQATSDQLVGKWYARANDCVDALAFDVDGTYSFDHMCELDDGSIGEQVHTGDYVATRSNVTLMPSLVSCPEVDARDVVVAYDLDAADALRVTLARGELALTPAREALSPPASPAGVVAYRFGCFASDGAFEPHSVDKF